MIDLMELVRGLVADGYQVFDGRRMNEEAEAAIDAAINAMSNVELVETISRALTLVVEQEDE